MDTLNAFGTLKIADVLEPAIELAEGGFVLSTLYVSTIVSLGVAIRVPVSEIHSGAVGTSLPYHGGPANAGALVATIRENHQGSIAEWKRNTHQWTCSTPGAVDKVSYPCTVLPRNRDTREERVLQGPDS